MKVGVLGPLLMCADQAIKVPTAPKQRQLLALLLLNANQVVPVSQCIEELWEYRPPASAVSTLHTYIMQLRRMLRGAPKDSPPGDPGGGTGCVERLVTRDRGYLFVTRPGELDVDAFEDRLRDSRQALGAGDDAVAAAALRDALAVWRGPALVDIQPGPVLRTWIASLEESRLSTIERRIEVDLRLGRHQELIGELSALVERHPVHENLHAHLMLALYRSGRQVHALEVFTRLRTVLSEELGLEPSPALRRLHQAVLASDPVLDPPPVHVPSRFSIDLDLGRIRRVLSEPSRV
ncbi:BTAD domain-containing putative transcriptional regulator [Dactylosporangium sp. NPDC048998]|uniref:AfsR/SARP family transcriptional regulator n=1 Tax=Dactylosporangium sp. NPDC048998 TaxID=3363976 RepID=UPI003723887D